jgi:hypothetical protein
MIPHKYRFFHRRPRSASKLHIELDMTKVGVTVGTWMARPAARLAFLARFAPMTARAYAAVLRVIVAERLWQVPAAARSGITPAGALGRNDSKGGSRES